MVMPCLNNANNINKILTHPQKMNNSHGHVPRNLKFNDHSIRNFVQSSSFLNSTSAIKQNLEDYNRQPTVPNVSNFTHKPNPKGFDFYNKRNLLLSQCNSEDIQVLNKNILLFAEDVVIFPQPATMKNIPTRQKSPVQAKPYTANNFYKPPANKIPNEQKSPKKSKQAEMNEFLFNYRKNQEQKKSKKLKFLQEMEKRLNNIQKQAAMITEKKQVQYEQINGILNLHSEATSFAKKAEVVGKLNATLYELKKQQNKPMSPRKITSEMGLIQINAAIEENHEYNDALLDEVERVSRSKSRERVDLKGKKQIEKEASFRKTGMKKGNNDDKPQNELSKTLKRPMQIPPRPVYSKKLTTTWRGK